MCIFLRMGRNRIFLTVLLISLILSMTIKINNAEAADIMEKYQALGTGTFGGVGLIRDTWTNATTVVIEEAYKMITLQSYRRTSYDSTHPSYWSFVTGTNGDRSNVLLSYRILADNEVVLQGNFTATYVPYDGHYTLFQAQTFHINIRGASQVVIQLKANEDIGLMAGNSSSERNIIRAEYTDRITAQFMDMILDMGEVKTAVQNAQTAATSAHTAASGAKSSADNAKSEATLAKNAATNANTAANNAITAANNAKSSADTAASRAWDVAEGKSAATLAKEARDKASAALTGISNVDTKVTDLQTSIDSKITNLQTNIENKISQIEVKIDQKDETPPSLEIYWQDKKTATKLGTENLYFNVNDNRTPTNQIAYEIKLNGAVISSGTGVPDSVSIPMGANGLKTLFVTVTDESGNSTQKSIQIWKL